MCIVLLFSFFTLSLSSVTSWIGGNDTSWWNPDNWDNGVPTTDSIVYINDTTCNDCTILIDLPTTVKELYLSPINGSGANLLIQDIFTITDIFVLGSSSSIFPTSIIFSTNGELHFEIGSEVNIYPISGYSISSQTGETGRIVNKGSVTISYSGDGSYFVIFIGSIVIDNWGNWISNDPSIRLTFENTIYNHYAGSYVSTWYLETDEPSIIWYDSDFNIQSDNATFNGPVSFYTSNPIDYFDYGNTLPNRIVFNSSDIVLSNARFNGVNILFNYDGWIGNSNFSDTAVFNSTGSFTASLFGNNLFSGVCLSSLEGGNLTVFIEHGSTVHMSGLFGLFGNVVFINNGTFIYESFAYFDWDSDALLVNLGLFDVVTYSIDYIRGSSFPGLLNPTEVGTFVNRGTVQFTSDGALTYYYGSGKYIQCENGVTKFGFGYPTSSDTPALVRLAEVSLDGYIALYYGANYSTAIKQSLFTWEPSFYDQSPLSLWSGDVSIYTLDVSNDSVSYFMCFDPTGYLYVYREAENVSCATYDKTYSPVISSAASGSVCSGVPEKFMNMTPSCNAYANCGLDTGVPTPSSRVPQPGSGVPQPGSGVPQPGSGPQPNPYVDSPSGSVKTVVGLFISILFIIFHTI